MMPTASPDEGEVYGEGGCLLNVHEGALILVYMLNHMCGGDPNPNSMLYYRCGRDYPGPA